MTEVETIKGKFVERRYELKNKHNLKIFSFREAMEKNVKKFVIKFEEEKEMSYVISIRSWRGAR